MSADQSEIQDLKRRLAEAERQLSRIRSGLKIGFAVLVLLVFCALIPPIAAITALALFGMIVLGALFAYMYGVAWVTERLTNAIDGEIRQPDQYE